MTVSAMLGLGAWVCSSLAIGGQTTLNVTTGRYYSPDFVEVKFDIKLQQKITDSGMATNADTLWLDFSENKPDGSDWAIVGGDLIKCTSVWAPGVQIKRINGPTYGAGSTTTYTYRYTMPVGSTKGTPVGTTTCYMPNRNTGVPWQTGRPGMTEVKVRGIWAASYATGQMSVYRNGQLVGTKKLNANNKAVINSPLEILASSGARSVDVVYADSVLFSGNNQSKEVLHLRWKDGTAGAAAKAMIRVASNLHGGSGKLLWDLDGMNVAEGIDTVVTDNVRLNATAVGWGRGEKGTGNATIEVWVP